MSLIENVQKSIDDYDSHRNWFPATRQQIVDLLQALESAQLRLEELSRELEQSHSELSRLRP